MKIISTVKEMQKISLALKTKGETISFVPTMGFLHKGHLSLIKIAKQQADTVIVSIFVNPTQFGPNEDLDKYPKDFKKDRELCENEGVDYLFYPDVKEIYPENFQTYIELSKLPKYLCGKNRPTHFKGVATVVTKLFNITQPDIAIFGKKDYQQFQIIKQMVKDLHLPIKIIGGEIIREDDGLAMSSRNKYLKSAERESALSLSKSLKLAEDLIKKGETNLLLVREEIKKFIESFPYTEIDYISTVDPQLLTNIDNLPKNGFLLALAVKVGRARLIDNQLIKKES